MASEVRRVHLPGGLFADVPETIAAEEGIGDGGSCTLSVVSQDWAGDDGVLLTGAVLAEDGECTIISCGGLLARVPPIDPHKRHGNVRIHLRRRDQRP